MSATTVQTAFRLDHATLARLDEIRRLLAERNPDLTPTRADAFRFLVNVGSGAAIAAASKPVRQPA